jgi:hypothetical protein
VLRISEKGRKATGSDGPTMRTVSLAAVTVVILIIGAFLIVANFSTVSLEYVCEGETRLGGPPQKDEGRLRVRDYRWWVGLWGDSHGGDAVFESKKFGRFSTLKLSKSDQGNFSLYMGLDPDQWFCSDVPELLPNLGDGRGQAAAA